MRRVWIEISYQVLKLDGVERSPSMRRVWIEIFGYVGDKKVTKVTLHAEGVD